MITIVRADITKLAVDAIVNAANSTLLGGGGVDGAIHRAAGPQLLEECRTLGGCPTGEARITGGYKLPARYVLHTVGPVWRGGSKNEHHLLAQCYRNTLALAEEHGIKTIAFPAISTGAFGFPHEQAAFIALTEMSTHIQKGTIREILCACFDSGMQALYEHTQRRIDRETGNGKASQTDNI